MRTDSAGAPTFGNRIVPAIRLRIDYECPVRHIRDAYEMRGPTMTSNAATARNRTGSTWTQKGALLFGVVFLIVGIAGFIPGLTMDMGSMSMAGHGSMALLLGLFQVSVLHNIVHLLFGIVGLVAARSASGARLYLVVGGIVYAVLFVYGLFTAGMADPANFVPLNSADNVLHAFLAVAMIILGFVLPRIGARTR
ncbi:uncharacterized protein DUF4383 [Curtobacterium sp. PhB172]|nr:uncharacterized protein DUF4383 [Curtobacterium sp. PhB171]ROQ25190.1 uncharacterized protein DUF4383 [Curtobacterium sp. PhB170]ROS36641.1 uncharacterized protein DUF4383 [Curtobacterium sp. PhB131]ROS70312.1 uncharacterized protein DUF4383 [Curtobacterium sp. PhB172]ROS71318.1 uncharacterized protein DUF4383 [Curtobacterium sp. PhB141]